MIKFLLCFLTLPVLLLAEIRETTRFEDLLEVADPETLVLIDMDDTLTDSTVSLGSSPWRHFLRKHFKSDIHDYYVYIIAKRVPVKTVEQSTPAVIQKLQEKNILTLCLTARGKTLWYSTPIDDIEKLTKQQLTSVNINLAHKSIPEYFAEVPAYSEGILFSAGQAKGKFLKDLLQKLNYFPKRVILIDDKREELLSVEKTLEEMDIPFLGLWYRAVENNRKEFNPHISNVQLEKLLSENMLLSDEEANHYPSSLSPEEDLQRIISQAFPT